MEIDLEKLSSLIYKVRGQKVMMDSDLAKLYGVETKMLNRQVRRNIKRFPPDFMFQASGDEHSELRYQFGTADMTSTWNHKSRAMPMLFTENGVAMLSGILRSDRAVEVNIAIMRIFTRLRSFLLFEKDLAKKVDELESNTTEIFKVVFQRLDSLEFSKVQSTSKKKIGIKG